MTNCSNFSKFIYVIIVLILFIILLPNFIFNISYSSFKYPSKDSFVPLNGFKIFSKVDIFNESAYILHFLIFLALMWFITYLYEKIADCEIDDDDDWVTYNSVAISFFIIGCIFTITQYKLYNNLMQKQYENLKKSGKYY